MRKIFWITILKYYPYTWSVAFTNVIIFLNTPRDITSGIYLPYRSQISKAFKNLLNFEFKKQTNKQLFNLLLNQVLQV